MSDFRKWSMKDWRGNIVQPGSRIVYPSRQSSSMWMVEAKVLSIRDTGENWDGYQMYELKVHPLGVSSGGPPSHAIVTLTSTKNITVIE